MVLIATMKTNRKIPSVIAIAILTGCASEQHPPVSYRIESAAGNAPAVSYRQEPGFASASMPSIAHEATQPTPQVAPPVAQIQPPPATTTAAPTATVSAPLPQQTPVQAPTVQPPVEWFRHPRQFKSRLCQWHRGQVLCG